MADREPATFSATTVATLERHGGALIAFASGEHVAVASGELAQVVQLLGPHAAAVACVDWSRADGALAAGAGDTVAVYADSGVVGAQRWRPAGRVPHGEAVRAVAWACVAGAPPALWAAGQSLVLWARAAGGWQPRWRRPLARPVALMAASADGRLLATAGEHERLVKVWTAADATQAAAAAEGTHGRDYTFCYLRHPAPLRSLQWRPPPRDAAAGDDAAAADGGGGAASAAEAAASSGARCCSRSPPTAARGCGCRRGRPSRRRTSSSSRVSCAPTIRTRASTLLRNSPRVAPSRGRRRRRAVAAVHWLQPTARAAPVPGRDDEASMRTPQSRGAAGRMSTSPVGLETPTLKPSLRDHHDYAAAVLADGTLVIWLVLGLSSSPRRTPEIIIWSSLPQLLPPAALRAHAAGAAAFAHFSAGGAAAALGGAAAADQLPSAVSLVHLIDDADAADANGGGTVRLCAIDVDRGAAGERVRVTTLGGHAVGAVVRSVLPHPSLPLVATLDSSGRAVVWGCALQGQPTTDAADATEADGAGAATLRYLAALSTPATAAAWLPGATSTQLLVASAASTAIEAHGRTAGGAWATHAAPLRRRRWPTGGGTTLASSMAATAARRTALPSARVVASPCGARGPTPAALRSIGWARRRRSWRRVPPPSAV